VKKINRFLILIETMCWMWGRNWTVISLIFCDATCQLRCRPPRCWDS